MKNKMSLKKKVYQKERLFLIILIFLIFTFLSFSYIGKSQNNSEKPEIYYFNALPNPVYLNGKVRFYIEAKDEVGLREIFLEDTSTGEIKSCSCYNSKKCSSETCCSNIIDCFTKEFNSEGSFKYCVWALNKLNKSSDKICIDISVFTTSECNKIKMSDSSDMVEIATHIKTRRIYKEKDGFDGYPIDCCPYCEDILINMSNCEKISGSFTNYTIARFSENEIPSIYGEWLSFPKNFLGNDSNTRTFVLCYTKFDGRNIFGIMNAEDKYQPISFIYSEDKIRYWFIKNREKVKSPYIFIPNSGENTLSKVYAPDCSEICRYDVGANPSRLAVNKDLSVWVGNRGSREITKVNGQTCDTINSYIVGSGPRGVAADIYGDIWVGCSRTNNVWELNGSSGSCIIGNRFNCKSPAIRIGDFPYATVADCLGNIWVLTINDNKLWKINSENGRIVMSIQLPDNAYGIAIDNNNNVWVSGDTIKKIDPISGEMICNKTLDGFINGIAVDNDNYVWGAQGELNKTIKIDQNCNLVAIYDSYIYPIGVAVDNEGYVWVVNRDSDNAWKFDPKTGDVQCVASLGYYPETHSSDMTGSVLSRCFNNSLLLVEIDKYILADEKVSYDKDEKEYIIVNAQNYSRVINTLLLNETYHKQIISLETWPMDCPEVDPRCPDTCRCGAGGACECCGECHEVYDYYQNTYKNLIKFYGRPYADYLSCYLTPLKSTSWCRGKIYSPSSAVNYPAYSFILDSPFNYSAREIEDIDDRYIKDIHKWNNLQEIQEMPEVGVITDVTKVPEVFCEHEYDAKAFRTVWANIFTVTPLLNDERNRLHWTKSGEGVIYAGSGFRREAARWWECCRSCAPFCPCIGGCLDPHFTSGVTQVIQFRMPDVKVRNKPIEIFVDRENGKKITITNGALTVVNVGNINYTVENVTFSKDEYKDIYNLTMTFIPIDNTKQFVVTQDVTFKYNLKDNEEYFNPYFYSTFTTSMRAGMRDINTTEEIDDSIGGKIEIFERKIDALKDALNNFIDLAVDKNIKVGLVAFSSYTGGRCHNGVCSWHEVSLNRSSLHDQISSYESVAGTCIACGVHKARELLGNISEQKYLVILSDGKPNACYSDGTFCYLPDAKAQAESEVTLARDEGIIVHTIALGEDADKGFLYKLARLGRGKFYDVDCECPLKCIYEKLIKEKLNNSVVLVNDVSESMELKLTLKCLGRGAKIIHDDFLRDVDLSISGIIDTSKDKFITQKGFINITIYPDILSKFILRVGNLSLEYSSLLYPIQHHLYKKEYGHGIWIPGYPNTPITASYPFGYLPAYMNYRVENSYGYDKRLPTSVNYEFLPFEQNKKICPQNCFCPSYDITDVTCVDYSENPPVHYTRKDCICMEKDQTYKRPFSSLRNFNEEKYYYYDFVDLYTLEKENLSVRGIGNKREEIPISSIGGLSGVVEHKIVVPPESKIVDVVFVGDTSNSMKDEWNTLCDVIEELTKVLEKNLVDFRFKVYAMGSWRQGASGRCVDEWITPVSGDIHCRTESWGPAVEQLAMSYQWRETAAKIIFPIGDEDPYCGCSSGHNTTKDDWDSIDIAAEAANENNVKVYGLWGDVPTVDPGCNEEIVISTFKNLSEKTGGKATYFGTGKELAETILYAIGEIKAPSVKPYYIINLSAIAFPQKLSVEDFKNASLTIFVHFRNNETAQTFSLFPARISKNVISNTTFHVDVKIRAPTEILIENITPGKYYLSPNTKVEFLMKLVDAVTGEGIPGEEIESIVEVYNIKKKVITDSDGKATLSIDLGEKSTNVNLMYHGSDKYSPSYRIEYLDIPKLEKILWLMSPEILLFLLVLFLLTFFYRWFSNRRFDIEEIIEELKGRKEE